MDKPTFESKEQFKHFLTKTLIPDLKASGTEATAEGFEEALYWLQKEEGKANYWQKQHCYMVIELRRDIDIIDVIATAMQRERKRLKKDIISTAIGAGIVCFAAGMVFALCIYQFGYWKPF